MTCCLEIQQIMHRNNKSLISKQSSPAPMELAQQGKQKFGNNETCLRLNPARLVCINPECTDHPFMCKVDKCEQCGTAHKSCKLYRLDTIFSRLSEKQLKITKEVDDSMKKMQSVYDEAIDRIMNDKEHSIMQMEYFGLNAYEAQFMHMINDGLSHQITGKRISHQLHKNLKEKQDFLATSESIQKAWKKFKEPFDRTFDQFKKMSITKTLHFDSVITDDFETIQSFFQDTISNMKLIFRASRDGSTAELFHSKCDGIQNTLVIIETEFCRIIGGFNPFPWNQYNAYSYDEQLKTFIFSITNKEKYGLIHPNQGTYGGPGYGPTFGGGHDIYITTGRNIRGGGDNYQGEDQYYDQEGSYFNFPHSFNTKDNKYQPGTHSSIQAFTGNTNGSTYSSVKDYQVYALEFL